MPLHKTSMHWHAIGATMLESYSIRKIRIRFQESLFSRDFWEKPVPTFSYHALLTAFQAQAKFAGMRVARERAMSVAGTYEVVTKTPMGEQKSILTVLVAGDSFTGSNIGPMGSLDITDGTVDGDTITWSNQITSPMPMKIDCKATVAGDAISGTVTAGMFGSFPLNGTRTA